MANETIGRIKCAICAGEADVRRYSRGTKKLYWYCACCGMITPNLPGGQEYILENARLFGPGGSPDEPPEKLPEKPVNGAAPEKLPEKPVNEPPPKRGFFDGLI